MRIIIPSAKAVMRKQHVQTHGPGCISLLRLLTPDITDWFELWKFVSHSSGSWSLRSGCSQGQARGEPTSGLADSCLAPASSHGGERGSSLLSLWTRTRILWDQDPTPLTSFTLNYFLKGPTSTCSHNRGQGFACTSAGHKHSVHIPM